MKRGINRLSDLDVKAHIKASNAGKASVTKLSDGQGLYLLVTPAGTGAWRMKYRLDGKEKVYSVGTYPDVDLAGARRARDAARELVKEGKDPVQMRRVTRQVNTDAGAATFADAAAKWLGIMKPDWSPIHYRQTSRALSRDVLPTFGNLPTRDITALMITNLVRAIKQRTGGTATAQKVLWSVRSIFEEEKTAGRVPMNPASGLRAVVGKGKKETHHAALLTFAALGDLLQRAEVAAISPQVRVAHRLIAFTASRISNAVEAQWPEFDLDSDTPTWTIPRAQMKVKDRDHDHRVLLSPTIANELRVWRRATGGAGYLFASPHGKQPHISREALEKVYRVTLNMAGTHSVHGWRASFSTLTKEHGFQRDAVELALDHIHDNAVVRAYDRGQRFDERLKLMMWWDAQLCAAQHGGDVLPLRTTAAR